MSRRWPRTQAIFWLAVCCAGAASADPGPFSTAGEGLSGFVRLAEDAGYRVEVSLTTPFIVGAPTEDTLVVIVAPQRPYSEAEIGAIEDFVARGGRLLVADDLGPGGDVAAAFGVQYDRVPLFTSRPVGPGGTGALVPAIATVDGVGFRTVLDLPTSLSPRADLGPNVTELAWTDASAFADLDGDQRIGVDDVPGPLLVGASLKGPDGSTQAAFLGDSGLLRNRLLAMGDNARFLAALLEDLLPAGGRLVVEHSRELGATARTVAAPVAAVVVATTATAYRWGLAVATTVMLAVLAWRYRTPEAWGIHRSETGLVVPRPRPVALSAEDAAALMESDHGPAATRGVGVAASPPGPQGSAGPPVSAHGTRPEEVPR